MWGCSLPGIPTQLERDRTVLKQPKCAVGTVRRPATLVGLGALNLAAAVGRMIDRRS
jgi:hypothetical protein